MCGYTGSEIVGSTLKCIQGRKSNPSTLQELRPKLTENVDCSTRLTNYRKTGESFENYLRIIPLKDDMQQTIRFLAVLEECF